MIRYPSNTATLILALLLLPHNSYGQQEGKGQTFRFTHLTGQLSLTGNYRTLDSWLGEINEQQVTDHLAAGFRISSGSYLWTPDIARFTVEGEYNHEFNDENYLIIPDRSEVRNLYKVLLRTDLLQGKDVGISAYTSLGSSYFNRENLTNIRSDNTLSGVLVTLSTPWLPSSIRFNSNSWSQLETESGREFSMDQKSVEAHASRSFTEYDRTELRYSYRDYTYRYFDLSPNQNTMQHAGIENRIWFDSRHNYSSNTSLNWFSQEGSYSFRRIEASERVVLHLPYRLDLNADYRFHNLERKEYSTRSNRAGIALSHRLYESLKSKVWTDLSHTSQGSYSERSLKAGFGFDYTKKTRIGRFNLSYNYFTNIFKSRGESIETEISLEEQTLSDSEVTTLDRPYIIPGSIVISDITSTITYQEGFDYLLGEVNNYTIVTRIPGGQIIDGESVLVSYHTQLPGGYNLTASNNRLSTGLVMFDRKLELYYTGAAQAYPEPGEIDFVTIDRYYQNLVGIRLNIRQVTAGAEYDRYNSSLVPYERLRYYLLYNKRIIDRMVVGINANLRDYTLLGTGIEQIYTNASARVSYQLSPFSSLLSEIGYLHQGGETINLDLITARTEYMRSVRKLTLKAGFNLYSREYSSSRYFFTRTYIEIIRKF